jgi:hypothetical protein
MRLKLKKRLVTFAAFVAAALFAVEGLAQSSRATEARVIFLTPYGFEPSEVTVKPGPVRLIVRSQVNGPTNFELTPTSRKIPEALVKVQNRRVARDSVTLAVGDYELSDPRYPQWKCTVQVRP